MRADEHDLVPGRIISRIHALDRVIRLLISPVARREHPARKLTDPSTQEPNDAPVKFFRPRQACD